MGIQASLTGHLVFSTLHTNDAPSAVTRMVDMGVAQYLVASSVVAILAQRLVRTICPRCKQPHNPPESIAGCGRLTAGHDPHRQFARGGDAAIAKTEGYRGRLGSTS